MAAEFDRIWPAHVAELVNVMAGLASGRRYRISDIQHHEVPPVEAECMVVYDLDVDDVAAIHQSNDVVRNSGTMVEFRRVVAPGNRAYVYSPIGTAVRARGWPGREAASGLYVVRSNPTRGREEDCERWYEKHLVEFIEAIDGYLGGQRYRLHAVQRAGQPPSPWQYLTIYERDDTDLEAIRRSFDRAATGGAFTPHGGAVAGDLHAVAYTTVGAREVRTAS